MVSFFRKCGVSSFDRHTSRAQPLSMAMVKPTNLLDRMACARKEHSDREKRARKAALVPSEGR